MAAPEVKSPGLPPFGKVGSAVGFVRFQDPVQGYAQHGFGGIYERATCEPEPENSGRSRLSVSEILHADAIRMTEFGIVLTRAGKVDLHIPWARINYCAPPKEG